MNYNKCIYYCNGGCLLTKNDEYFIYPCILVTYPDCYCRDFEEKCVDV